VRDGKARRVRNVTEAHRYVDNRYVMTLYSGNHTTPHGHLLVGSLQPRVSDGAWPTFEFRWDDRGDILDVDVSNVSKSEMAEFKTGTDACYGHHARKMASSSRVFEADIVWKGLRVYSGQIGFSLERETAVHFKAGTKTRATATVTHSLKRAASVLGLSHQHARHFLAKGATAGKKLGRDWMVNSFDYLRKGKPKRRKKERSVETS
jgi:hypothetical protein